MKNRTLYILRGVSSAGKTTLANTLQTFLPQCVDVAADDFHYNEKGEYDFKIENLAIAHNWCRSIVEIFMIDNKENIVVHNTNTTEKEINPYIALANKYGYRIVSLVVEKRHENINDHNVPTNILKNQEQRLRGSLKLK